MQGCSTPHGLIALRRQWLMISCMHACIDCRFNLNIWNETVEMLQSGDQAGPKMLDMASEKGIRWDCIAEVGCHGISSTMR
jgi:hypothetical protein